MCSLRKILVSTAKELRLVLRDPEGLGILFLMPLAFVVIMSLALQDFFRQGNAPQFGLVVLDADNGEVTKAINDGIVALPLFKVETRPTADFASAARALRNEVLAGKRQFALLLPPQLSARHERALASGDPQRIMNAASAERVTLAFLADPALRADARELARTAIERVVFGVEMRRFYTRYTGFPVDPARKRGLFEVATHEEEAVAAEKLTPTSTQQNVPAYSLLAIFLLVVPLSGAFIKERAQGTLSRLRAMPVRGAAIVAGKVLPYFAINLLQMALCFAVGRWLLPRLGAPALQFGDSPLGIFVLTAAASLAAIGFGLLVAVFARTTEQATAFGAASILILAALGGIMVPKLLMPPALQSVAAFSPLGWALDGFLDLFVRGAGVARILPRAGMLLAFAGVCFGIAIWRFARLSKIN
jgi:ABC-2 type transport system permease protein